jgi:hypothetical protein
VVIQEHKKIKKDMPRIEIERIETYNAQTGEVTVEEREITVQTNEELIEEKQDELLKVYAELQVLLGTTQSNA